MQIAYIVNCDSTDIHLEMSLVSSVSARISNPSTRIIWLCDQGSVASVQAALGKFETLVDELVVVKTPVENNTYRNRWIKTQLPRFIQGNTLYLDSDTLVRKKINHEDLSGVDFAAVANHNGFSSNEQIWEEDEKFLELMNWGKLFFCYVNGGVWYFRHGGQAEQLFDRWHSLWLEGAKRTGRLRDQPALNVALRDSDVRFSLLSRDFNEQVQITGNAYTEQAKIWHFYGSGAMQGNGYGKLLSITSEMSPDDVWRVVGEFISGTAPWVDQGWISRRLWAKRAPQSLPAHALHWLNGHHGQAVKSMIKRFGNGGN